MQEIIKFLVENWQPILSAFLSFVAVILVIVKKRPVATSLMQYIQFVITELPYFIVESENLYLDGEAKKECALDQAMCLLHKLVKCSGDDDVYAKRHFSAAIENILLTPQKKDIK